MSKQNIYDNDLFYENFEKIRSEKINFNDIIETPIILRMIPELYEKKVLDIGCGMGQYALQYSKNGALSVLGIDISEKMLAYARKNNGASNREKHADMFGGVIHQPDFIFFRCGKKN